MKYTLSKIFVFFIILLIAAALRLPRLTMRPMHTDEAIHAVKFGTLLEKGEYSYDSNEYHGPTLNYFTLIPAWLKAQKTFIDTDEATLRLIPVAFGIGLILLLLLVVDGLSWPVILAGAFFTAVSPAMVFYSRYYIMEILLVCFSFGVIVSGYRYLKSKNIFWAASAGLFFGLMHATKETCIIVYGAMGLALFLVWLFWYRKDPFPTSFDRKTILRHSAVFILSAAIVSALFFSSFGRNPKGVLDSILTFKSYFFKAGNFNFHIYPWDYYFKLLLYSKSMNGPVWTEVFILISGALGFFVAVLSHGVKKVDTAFLRFIALYTFILAVVHSIIPYKTPWIMLGFLHGLILLAGAGIIYLFKLRSGFMTKLVLGLIFFAGGTHLIWQSYLSNFKYYTDPGNPYVYSHPGKDIFTITQRIKDLAKINPDGFNTYIEVICPDDDYWPLPWYLREFPNIGWWNKVNMQNPAAPIILASPRLEPDVMYKLYELPPPGQKNLYVPLFDTYMELRPLVEIRGYVKKELWDRYYYQQTPDTNR
ncbi:TIGR03663 family protein [candidate division KSB1 bacterium]|nr:TIGR03663 family protein [candidate division KSB1 bacterium]